MRLLIDEPNPLNSLEIRELNFIPKSWEKVNVSSEGWRAEDLINNLRKWVYNNLSGRFAITSDVKNVNNKLEIVYQIGFETPGESTMFSLGCSLLHDQDVRII